MAVAPSNAAARCERSDYQNKQNNQFVWTNEKREKQKCSITLETVSSPKNWAEEIDVALLNRSRSSDDIDLPPPLGPLPLPLLHEFQKIFIEKKIENCFVYVLITIILNKPCCDSWFIIIATRAHIQLQLWSIKNFK